MLNNSPVCVGVLTQNYGDQARVACIGAREYCARVLH
jgi:hypothetical protein